MKKVILGLSVLSLFLSSCNYESKQIDPLTNDSSILTTKKNELTDMVDKKNLETNMSILSGYKTDSPTRISERGSVKGRESTKMFITEYLTSLGYKVERHKYRTNGENIIAKLPAEVATDEHILLGAHLDSVSNPGADDNASGTVAVLETARVLKELKGRKVNIIFAWFDEEELGLIGSNYLAKDYKKQGLKLTSAHTADMIGYDSDKDKVIEIEQPDGNLWDVYNQANKSHGLNYKLVRTSSGQTDHESFREYGFNSVGLCEEWVGKDTTPQYHKKTDTYETLSFDMIEASTKLMIAVASDLTQKVVVKSPTKFIPHSNFPKKERHFHYKGFSDLDNH
ncbi:MAG: M28 family metallopeptidase [Candidatus Sericytochromatia bacterium]